MKKIPSNIAKLNQNLTKRQVRYVHWKSNIHIINGLIGDTDLDVLIHNEDKYKFEKVAKECFFIKVTSPIWCKYPYIEDFVGCDPDTGVMIHLHVHYKMLTGFKRVKHFRIPWESEILSSRIIDDSVSWPVPNHVDEFIVFLMRMNLKSTFISSLLGSANYPKSVVKEYQYLMAKVDKHDVIKRLSNLGVVLSAKKIESIFIEGNFKHQREISNEIISQIKDGGRYSYITTLFISFVNGVVYWNQRRKYRANKLSIFKKTVDNGGLLIAIIGVDGSGKSSLAKVVREWLIPKIDTHNLYLGSGDGSKGPVENIRSNLRRKIPRKNNNSGYIRTIARSIFDVLLLSRKTLLIIKASKLTRKGSIVVADRFPQSAFFGIADGPKVHNYKVLYPFAKLEKFLFKIIERYKPDVVIKLVIDFETSVKRKPDENHEVVKKKIMVINKINYDNEICIDAKRDFSTVVLDIKRHIWKEIYSKANG